MDDAFNLIVAIEQAISNYRLKTGLVVKTIHVNNECPAESAVTFEVIDSKWIAACAEFNKRIRS